MFIYETNIRVRYAETDQMKYVYYGNYAMYYEVARVEAFRHLGIPYLELEAEGIMMPVFKMNTTYLHPAKYDDLLTIRVLIRELPTVRIVFDYEVYNENKALLNTGQTTLVFVNMQNNRPMRCPAALRDALSAHFTN